MSSGAEENKALVRRCFEAHAKGDLDAVEELLAPNFVDHDLLPGPPLTGERKATQETCVVSSLSTVAMQHSRSRISIQHHNI